MLCRPPLHHRDLRPGEPPQGQLDGGEGNEGGQGFGKVLEVLSKPPVSAEPGEGALDHPAAWEDDEALHVVAALDDLHAQHRHPCHRSVNLPGVVAAIGPDQFEPGEAPAYLVEDPPRDLRATRKGWRGPLRLPSIGPVARRDQLFEGNPALQFERVVVDAEVPAELVERGDLVGQLDLDPPHLARIFAAPVEKILDNKLFDRGELIARCCGMIDVAGAQKEPTRLTGRFPSTA